MARIFPVVVGMLLALLPAAALFAQSFPTRPVKIVIPQNPGGHSDAIGRTIGPKLAEILQQPVVIDNRGGAGGTIGAEMASRAPHDGYTLLLGGSNNLAIAVALAGGRAIRPPCATSCRSAGLPSSRTRLPCAPAFRPRRSRSC